jgi:excisionase family DNA binding protein
MKTKTLSIETALQRAAISIPEYAALIGIHPITIYKMAEKGDLETIRIGTRRLVPHRVYAGLVATSAE